MSVFRLCSVVIAPGSALTAAIGICLVLIEARADALTVSARSFPEAANAPTTTHNQTAHGEGRTEPESIIAKQPVGFSAEQRALKAARKLIPTAHAYEIVIIDPELAADSAAIRRVDAFIVRDADGRLRPKVYVNRESHILQQAARGVDFYVKILAAVIVHEIEHLRGGTESVARSAEQTFLEDLVARGLVVAADGRRYLALLRHQPREDGAR